GTGTDCDEAPTGTGAAFREPGSAWPEGLAASPASPRSRAASKEICISLNRDHLACHDEGSVTRRPCTAVTLYSGQSVAQSVASVVTTLAPDSGKWKVVYTTPGCTLSVTSARSTVSPERLCSATISP